MQSNSKDRYCEIDVNIISPRARQYSPFTCVSCCPVRMTTRVEPTKSRKTTLCGYDTVAFTRNSFSPFRSMSKPCLKWASETTFFAPYSRGRFCPGIRRSGRSRAVEQKRNIELFAQKSLRRLGLVRNSCRLRRVLQTYIVRRLPDVVILDNGLPEDSQRVRKTSVSRRNRPHRPCVVRRPDVVIWVYGCYALHCGRDVIV